MAVTIQDVLALLPQLFPGVQKIPYSNLHPNPDNPGAPLSDQDIQDLADNLAERGLVNPLKVQPDPLNPLVGGVKPHSEDPKLTAEGRPWTLGDFNYRLLAGERRYRAAGRLGWAELPAFILNPSQEEAVEITHLDNDVRDRGWWAGYQSIEQLVKANPNLAQSQVATKLKMDPTKVGKALRLLPLLDQASRKLIVGNSDNSNKGIRGISESAISRLADLGPGSALKPGVKKAGDDSQKLWPYPAIPAETLDLVRRTLTVAVDEQMTEAGVKGLVAWAQDGGNPEKYGVKAKAIQGTRTNGKEDIEPIPIKDDYSNAEQKNIPTSRIRVNNYIAACYRSVNIERQVYIMKKTPYAEAILVRSLSTAEKQADPNHDYELFHQYSIFKAAQALGWSELNALIYHEIDEWAGVRLHNSIMRGSRPLSWIENYIWIADRVAEESNTPLEEWAYIAQENAALIRKATPLLKLLNEKARKAIWQSVNNSYEDGDHVGGYEFSPELFLLLAPLEGKDLAKTQKIFEQVINKAIEHEMYEEDLEALVDWVLAGNEPEGYFKDEAVGHEAEKRN